MIIKKYRKGFVKRGAVKKIRQGFFQRPQLKSYISALIFFYSSNLKKKAVNLSRKHPRLVSNSNIYNILFKRRKRYTFKIRKLRRALRPKKRASKKLIGNYPTAYWSLSLFRFHTLDNSKKIRRTKSYKLEERIRNKVRNIVERAIPKVKSLVLVSNNPQQLASSIHYIDINYFATYLLWLNSLRIKLNTSLNLLNFYQLFNKKRLKRRLSNKFLNLTRFFKLKSKRISRPLLYRSRDLLFYDLHRKRAISSLKIAALHHLKKFKSNKFSKYRFLSSYLSRRSLRLKALYKHQKFNSWDTISSIFKKQSVYFLNKKRLKYFLKVKFFRRKFYKFKKFKERFRYFQRLSVRRRGIKKRRKYSLILRLKKVRKFLKAFFKGRRHRKLRRKVYSQKVRLSNRRFLKSNVIRLKKKIRAFKKFGIKVSRRSEKKFIKLIPKKKSFLSTSLKRTRRAIRRVDYRPYKFKPWLNYKLLKKIRFKKLWKGLQRKRELEKKKEKPKFTIYNNIINTDKKIKNTSPYKDVLRVLKLQLELNSNCSFNLKVTRGMDRIINNLIKIKRKYRRLRRLYTFIKYSISEFLYKRLESFSHSNAGLTPILRLFSKNSLINFFSDKLFLLDKLAKSTLKDKLILTLKALNLIEFYLLKLRNIIKLSYLEEITLKQQRLENELLEKAIKEKKKRINLLNLRRSFFFLAGVKSSIKKRKSKKKRQNLLNLLKSNKKILKRLGFIKRHQFFYIKKRTRIFRERSDIWLQPSLVLTNFKNILIKKGHSFRAENIIRKLELNVKFNLKLQNYKTKNNINSLLPWFLSRFRPIYGVKPRRKGSAIIQIPMLLNSKRSSSTGHREFIRLTSKRQERKLEDRLINELIGTIENRSSTYKLLTENLKLTFANRVLL